MSDPTEQVRRGLVADINREPKSIEELRGLHGEVWTMEELTREFTVHGFMAPFVTVTRKSDGVKGCLEFQHSPRAYYGFTARGE